VLQRLTELAEKYPGKYACFAEGEPIAINDDVRKAYEEAVKREPGKRITIAYVPTEEELEALL